MTTDTQASIPLGHEKSSVSRTTGLLFGGFVLTGVVTTLLGPVLPYLATRWNLNDSRSGLFFTAQFAGSMAGVLLSSWILSRRGPRAALMTGYATMGMGVAALAINSWTIGMLSIGCFGFGLGLVIPTTNLLIAESNPNRRAASLSMLNLCWGLGAVAWPIVAAGFVKLGHIPATLIGLGAGTAAICGALTNIQDGILAHRIPRLSASPEASSGHFRTTTVVLIGLLFFLYVGTENSLGGWIATLAHRTHANGALDWTLLPSFFWGGLLAGRAMAPVVLRRIQEIALARECLLVALSGAFIVLTAGSTFWFVVGVTLSALGLSCIFPITVSQFSLRFGHSARHFLSGMFALASLGGATLPWLVGFVSNLSGSLRTGFWVPVSAIFSILALYLIRFDEQSDGLDGN
ncbi:MAG TPA: MFS transporter [Terriglobales bacterium]|nr:MFS transporter [Terriglobales bacterium]